MKVLLLLTFVALATACDDCVQTEFLEPVTYVKRIHRVDRNEPYSFKFSVASMEPLRKGKVHLKKVAKGEERPNIIDTEFEVRLRVLNNKEIKEWRKTVRSRRGQKPVPHYKHVIVGEVKTSKLKCSDNTHYLVRYGKINSEDQYPRSINRHGAFFINVEGCKNPHPNPQGPPIFVKGYQVATLNQDHSFEFVVTAVQPIYETNIYLKKILEAEDGSVGDVIDARFKPSLARLTEEELKDLNERKRDPSLSQFKEGIRGTVIAESLTCEDQGPYMVLYGRWREEFPHPHPSPRPRPRGFFFIVVEGCDPPKLE